jgi:Tol biopolymer transport system component
MERSRVALRIASVCALLSQTLAAQSTTLVSCDSNGVQGNYHSDDPALSDDGRYVVFSSQASNLVPSDNNSTEDVFLRDRLTGATTCVSLGLSGTPSLGQASTPAMSSDARYIAFWSNAWNIVSGNMGVLSDIFVRDMQTGVVTRISDGPGGSDGNNTSYGPSMSGDGRLVAFHSYASNLVAGDTNGAGDVFLWDAQNPLLQRVSVTPSGGNANGHSVHSSLSRDGRFIAFASLASNLIAGDTNGVQDVFVRELATGITTRVSVDPGGAQGNGASDFPSLSSDGRLVAFESAASNLVAGDTSGMNDIFVHDRLTGATTRVSVSSSGVQGHDDSWAAHISGDGRFVVFLSVAANLVAGDTNVRKDHFLHDRATGVTTRVSVDSAGNQGDHICYASAISVDGLVIAFSSMSTNLVPNDTNGRRDIFVRERFERPNSYCTASVTTHGCVPSIASTGLPSASAVSGFTLHVTSVEGFKTGIVFYGVNGRVESPWASGSTSYLCVKAPTQRTPAANSGGTLGACDGSLSLDLLAYLAANPAALGSPIAMGLRIDAQAWFRDPPAPKTTNLSNALEFDVVP